MENYILTGATGHLGNNVLKKLPDDSNILLLVLPNEDVSFVKKENVKIAYGDIRDKKFLQKYIKKNSYVIHMAGIIDISSDNKNLLYDINVNGTKNVVDVCMEKNVKKLVYTSSVHAIVPKKKKQIMYEPTEFNENNVVGDYAKSKVMATKYVFEKCKQGLNAVVIYPSGIIGPNDIKISNTAELIIDIANKDIRARINGGYNFVDVRDVAQGIVNSIEKGKTGEGYILSGNLVTIDNIFDIVNKRFGRKKNPPKIATWFVKLFAGLAELYYKVRKKKPLFTRYSLYTITSNHNFSNEKAKKELDFKTRSAKKTIIDTLDWLIKYRTKNFKLSTLEEYKNNKK